MKFEIVSPTKAHLLDASQDELSALTKELTYTNTATQHELKRLYNNQWLRNKNRSKWEADIAELKSKVVCCLLFSDGSEYPYIRPGSISYLGFEGSPILSGIKYPTPKKVPWAKPIPFNLHEYQQASIEKLIEVKHGAVSLTTGSGKSAIILNILRETGFKSVVVVPSASIFNELKEKMELHLGKANVGYLGDGKKRLGKRFTIAISDSLSNLKPNTCEYDFFKNQEAFLADECFPYRTPVLTENGYKEIGSIYKSFMEGLEVKVLSFNENYGFYEYRKVINSWEIPTKGKLIEIKSSSLTFRCTENHKVLTSVGWICAKNIKKGDKLCGYRGGGTRSSVSLVPNSDQSQVILGSYLGDGSISLHGNGLRMRIIHGINQLNYLKWKSSILNVNKIEKIEKNGFSKKNAFRFQTKLLNFDQNISFSSPKGKGLKEILYMLDARGVAIWLMDDGSRYKNMIRFHTESFDFESQMLFVEFFKEKFGINVQIKIDQGEDYRYYYLSLSSENSKKLTKIVAPYMFSDMLYKICDNSFSGKIVPEIYKCPYIWNNKYKDYGYATVVDTKSIYSNSHLYDIEVEENHNFLVGKKSGAVVHNCHTLPAETLDSVCHGVLSEIPYRMFFSATHTRGDGSLPLLQSITGPIVHTLSTSEAIKGGFISDHDFLIVDVESSNPNINSPDVLEMKRIHFLRNRNIAAFIAKLANASAAKGEQTLVLVEELQQIAMLIPLLNCTYAYAHSEKSAKKLSELEMHTGTLLEKVDRAESVEKFNKNEAKVLIGTSCIATGTNIYPMRYTCNWVGGSSEIRTKQGAVGRTVRLSEQNPFAAMCQKPSSKTIVDFNVHDVFILKKHLEDRCLFYRDSGTEIRRVKIKR